MTQIERSSDTLSRDESTLDICRLGNQVELRPIVRFIPESILAVFSETLAKIDGKAVKDLTANERQLMEIVVVMGNAHLVYALASGEYQDSLWTEGLRTAVLRYKKKSDSTPLQTIRNEDCVRRRNWVSQIRKLFPYSRVPASV